MEILSSRKKIRCTSESSHEKTTLCYLMEKNEQRMINYNPLQDVFQPFNSGGIYNIVYETGTSLAVQRFERSAGQLPRRMKKQAESLKKTVHKGLSCVKVEPVGRWYEAYCLRQQHKQTLSHHSIGAPSSSSDSGGDLSADDEDDEQFFLTLDPKEWKDQDHYAVLGLKKLRHKATDDQIKRAYKKKVLKHHPDKRRARGCPVNEGEEDYFTCITRAWETLGNPTRRRAYDSIDPEFDDTVPSIKDENKENFFKAFGPAFERNSRWSNKQKKCPLLGKEDEPFDKVDYFYSYWYEFDSWREYSYLDEEEKEKGENREERRWIEKQNKAARGKRKKEEVVRIRLLVDNAYACDPRIAKHRDDEKQKKQRVKDEKRDLARKRQEEDERVKREALEVERLKKEKEDEEARGKAAILKKEKEAQKKVMKKERKTLRTQMKDFEYFSSENAAKVHNMQEVEKLAEMLSLASIQSLNSDLTSGDTEKAKAAFHKHVADLAAQKERETQELLEQVQKQSSGGGAEGKAKSKGNWSDPEVQLLIKGVNLFPAGTVERWETVASFITQHCPTSKRSAKEVLAKAKDLQKNDSNLKESANKGAFDRFAKDMKGAASTENNEMSKRYMSVAESNLVELGTNPAPWTPEEQKLLEQAMRTYGASVENRWDKIADAIADRSKKDCMKRYKELVEMVKAKKLAQLEAQKKVAAAKK